MRLRTGTVAGMAIAALAVLTTQAGAQSSETRFGFPERVLDAYAEASVDVLAIYRDNAGDFEDARGDRAAMREVRARVNARMREVIQGVDGINVRQFKRVSMTARTNRDLYEDLESRVEAVRKRNDGSE